MGRTGESPVGRVRATLAGEGGRRLVHASGSVLPGLYLLDVASWRQVTALFVLGMLVAGGLEALRLWVGLEWRIYEHLTREYEADSVAGYLLYMVSAAVVTVVFDAGIAVPSILMLTLADPIGGFFGTGELRPIKHPRALVPMFLLCTTIALPFVPLPVAALGGLAGMLADGVKLSVGEYIVDDNLTIPPAAALALSIGLEAGVGL